MIKRWFLLPVLAFLCLHVSANRLNAGFNYSVFYSPAQGPYIETWLSVNAATVEFIKLDNELFRGEVEVILIFYLQDSIVDFLKYDLFSNEITDTNDRGFGFLDRQRFLLPEGEYLLSIQLRDLNSDRPPVEKLTTITITDPVDKPAISTVQLIERVEKAETPSEITKGGYNLYPDMQFFYPQDVDKIYFYCELYNTENLFGKDSLFLISAFIETFETRKILNNIIYYKREKAAQIIPFIHTFDIKQLPSGNYYLAVEIRDRENKLIADNRTFFQRSNPAIQMRLEDISAINVIETFTATYENFDKLLDYIKSCYPIASQRELAFAENIIASKDIKQMQQFFYHFWYTRNSSNPESEWLNYKVQVDRVNASYSNFIRKGYETDRGRIYLRYGEPNSIYRSTHEPEAYPYEIWHYYQLTEVQHNRRFVFISTDLNVVDFELAHSNAIGEIHDPQWHLRLHGRQVGGTNIDRTEYDSTYGSRALEKFNNPF